MVNIDDTAIYISKSQLRHHLQTYFVGMTDAMADACTSHVFGNEKAIQQAEAMRCPHCHEIRIDDIRVERGQECSFCKETFEPVAQGGAV